MEPEVRRYRVIEAVGRGGFGTVYRAELVGPSGFKKQVALKVLNPDAPEAIGVAERLRDEARVLGMLRHRAIVQVDGLHMLNGRWTVVMEFVEGVDLKQLLADGGRVPPGIAIEIVQEIANALHYAYEMSVDRSVSVVGMPTGSLRLMHRDIKPGNVQLTAAGEVKVLDFGVARADFADREAVTQSIYFGSLNYMSPERLDGIDDHKGDIYALGAVLYELVMGEALGRTSANRERHDARLREALNGLWQAEPDEDLYRLVAECLLYDPDARPTARELERACRTLRPRFGAPWLSEWAEDTVPALLARRPPIKDDLSGATLVEAGGVSGGVTSGVAPKPAAPNASTRRGGRRSLVVLGVAALSALVVAGGGLFAASMVWPDGATRGDRSAAAAGALDELGEAFDAEPTTQPAVVDLAPPVDEDAAPDEDAAGDAEASAQPPVVVAEPTPARPEPARAAPSTTVQPEPHEPEPHEPEPHEPEPHEPEAHEPEVRQPEVRQPEPVAAVPEPAAAPAASGGATGTVRVVRGANAARVTLVGANGSHGLGRVPTGTYTIEARFTDGTTDRSVEVTVSEGSTVQLSCVASLHKCLAI